MTQKTSWTIVGTLLADLFFLWVIVRYAMGGWQLGLYLLTRNGIIPWLILAGVLFLLLYRSDYRTDLPIFVAAVALGYWGEWWGTTRGLWTYWNGQTPPSYLPPLWGIGLLTVYRLHLMLIGLSKTAIPASKGVRKKNKPNRSRRMAESGQFCGAAWASLCQKLATLDARELGRYSGCPLLGRDAGRWRADSVQA
jgi:hypothetical protein